MSRTDDRIEAGWKHYATACSKPLSNLEKAAKRAAVPCFSIDKAYCGTYSSSTDFARSYAEKSGRYCTHNDREKWPYSYSWMDWQGAAEELMKGCCEIEGFYFAVHKQQLDEAGDQNADVNIFNRNAAFLKQSTRRILLNENITRMSEIKHQYYCATMKNIKGVGEKRLIELENWVLYLNENKLELGQRGAVISMFKSGFALSDIAYGLGLSLDEVRKLIATKLKLRF